MGGRKRERALEIKEAKKSLAFAKLNNCPTSPRKMRLVADLVRGVEVEKAQADRIAEMKVNDSLKNPIQQGILVDEGKHIKLDLVLENGELKLNGKVIPEEQVASIFFFIAMLVGD